MAPLADVGGFLGGLDGLGQPVLREVQILECLSPLSGVYFGDEGCGGPVLEPADEQRVSEDTYIPEDEADT